MGSNTKLNRLLLPFDYQSPFLLSGLLSHSVDIVNVKHLGSHKLYMFH